MTGRTKPGRLLSAHNMGARPRHRRDRVAEGVDDRSRGMKIGLAELEVNDGAALALEFLGAGEDGEGAFARELRNARCMWTHGVGGSVGNIITSRRVVE